MFALIKGGTLYSPENKVKNADLLIVNDAMEIDTVMARGRVMVDHGDTVIKGSFED